MQSLLLLVGTLLINHVSGASYSIYCTDNSAGYCTRWEIDQPSSECFPSESTVNTTKGIKAMADLQRGDMILGMIDEEQKYTPLTSWLHREEGEEREFLRLRTVEGDIQVSAKHNLASRDGSYGFAEELESLFGVGDIIRKEHFRSKGVYAPKTGSNNFFVYLKGNPDSKTLAHCFAHIRSPSSYESIVQLVEWAWNRLDNSAMTAQVHPSYIWLQRTFSFLQE